MRYGIWLSYPSVFSFVLRSSSFFVVVRFCANDFVFSLCNQCFLRVFTFITSFFPLVLSTVRLVCLS